MSGETRWQKLFGTPEKVADFIIKNCGWDCYVCPFQGDICGKDYSPNSKDRDAILEWLGGDAE